MADHVVVRSIQAKGAEAMELTRQWGWDALPEARQEFTLLGDIIKSGELAVARYWHTQSAFTYRMPEGFEPERSQIFLACLEGEMTVTIAGHEEQLKPGRVLIVNPEDLVGKRCDEAVATLLIFFPRLARTSANLVSDAASPSRYLPILISTVNAMLNSKIHPSAPTFVRIERALRELIVAISSETDLLEVTSPEPACRRLHSDAIRVIEETARDATTTIATIAQTLGVSRSQLNRAFAEAGDTPSANLRRARVRLALQCLAQGESRADAAARSGFGSTRRLRRALLASGGPGPNPRQ
ncbi:helix-turn-helix domain-containing protein [Pseudoclavibacter sp. VKM Ac-2888]|uniref:helix-turn-helix domain-containing protein n=1 Tax=Pseudoclavibacter sp. VKM Ac-2888 TaxID=2783830 RepID=UPI00188B7251|nr:helix-turn-helix domain-containing protein [Pseudoclavibacter sp. VKM Ac-2888]MBF4549406.1 AraC family transcriptional regulator [Pseudoclavibacter sp. VKM Ac-2888]